MDRQEPAGVSSYIIKEDHQSGRSHPRQSPPPSASEVLRFADGLQRRPTPTEVPARDRKREMKWIADNRATFAGRWAAVEGDRLVAAAMDARKVFSAAKAEGIAIPFVVHILPEDSLPFVPGW